MIAQFQFAQACGWHRTGARPLAHLTLARICSSHVGAQALPTNTLTQSQYTNIVLARARAFMPTVADRRRRRRVFNVCTQMFFCTRARARACVVVNIYEQACKSVKPRRPSVYVYYSALVAATMWTPHMNTNTLPGSL